MKNTPHLTALQPTGRPTLHWVTDRTTNRLVMRWVADESTTSEGQLRRAA